MTSNPVFAGMLQTISQSRPSVKVFRPKDLREIFQHDDNIDIPTIQAFINQCARVGHGKYSIAAFGQDDIAQEQVQSAQAPGPDPIIIAPQAQPEPSQVFKLNLEASGYVPEKDKTFVRWGHYRDVVQIIKSGQFFPTMITGLSGNGKSVMVEQACADTKRKYVRVQISPETDEDDLIGGFRLKNGETVFEYGPVVRAMKEGSVLNLDEFDRGDNKIMCLQGVMEGKPIQIKKTGEIITPAPGFQVFACCNTKGQGSDDGKFIAASIVDEAFLERFVITMEQPYPNAGVERRIVVNHMNKFGEVDETFAQTLVDWSTAIRKTYDDGGIEDVISTRRLCHVAQTYAIFKKRKKAVELSIARFNEETKAAFIELYTKLDKIAENEENTQSPSDIIDDLV